MARICHVAPVELLGNCGGFIGRRFVDADLVVDVACDAKLRVTDLRGPGLRYAEPIVEKLSTARPAVREPMMHDPQLSPSAISWSRGDT
jgi:hypothetical protein